jgi:hypothetical protein
MKLSKHCLKRTKILERNEIIYNLIILDLIIYLLIILLD